MRFTIRAKILLGYLSILLCLAVAIVIIVTRINALQSEINFVADHDIAVHEMVDQLEINMLDMQNGQRGYVISGDEKYLVPYNDANLVWGSNYNTLHELLSDNPAQQANLEEIKGNIEQWGKFAGQPVVQLRKENKMDAIRTYYASDLGKEIVEKVRTQLDQLRTSEKELTKQRVETLSQNNVNLQYVLFIAFALVTISAIAAAMFVSGAIVRTIRDVKHTIRSIIASEGDINERIRVNTKDEIRELAEATNELLDNVNEESWVQKRTVEVADMYQGFKHIADLSEAFVYQVTPMLDATYSAIYLRHVQNGVTTYVKTASFAGHDHAIEAAVSFKPGEGIAGQCVVDKRLYHLTDLPMGYVKVRSSLGEASPRSLLVAPVFFEGKVLAVVEFASLGSFEDKHLTLIKALQESLGVAINSVVGRMEIERLLNESQMLTEELQAQSEELQAQSEEMQMQQEQLRLTNDYLQEQRDLAEQRNTQLEQTKHELEDYSEKLVQSSQYKTDFLANMSHELRTPLNSILILSQMLYENENKTMTEEEQHYSHVIHSAGKDLLSLIDDILDLSKIEAGKLEVTIDDVNMTEIPMLMRQLFDPVAEKKQLSFVTVFDEQAPPIISTDGHRLQHILKNLLSNAFKFTDSGSVRLSISSVEQARMLELYNGEAPSDTMIAISVTDSGIGISPDKQAIIFEAFQQADGTTNRQYGGTGLGLSICREFTRLLGGRLQLESVEGEGSTFTLYLPSLSEEFAAFSQEMLNSRDQSAAGANTVIWLTSDDAGGDSKKLEDEVLSEEEAAQLKAHIEDTRLFEGKRVLLVDDDDRNVFALKTALASKGVIVESASNGKLGLELLNKQPDFDIILMDIMMPVMDGLEAIRSIRSNPVLKELPIIALTAKAMRNDRERCMQAGASDYISKPLQIEQLYSLLRVWMTKQEGR
ncbi:histidine kinase [Paenibacillus sp. Leaf72]|nr:histidine kinase [Paenibacillus sp. Leaf72]